MVTSYMHLLDRVFGKPLAATRDCIDVTLAVLAPRLGIVSPLAVVPVAPADPKRRSSWKVDGGVARIQVMGRLVQRAGMSPDSGDMTSYSELGDELDAALEDDNVSGVLLDFDSPGGEVAGMFDLAAKIAGAGKPVYASANEAAYSGAYALAAACDRVYVARTGGVGSIGVYVLHCDKSGADKAAGLSYTYIHSGSKKVDANPHAALSPSAHGDLQGEVDELRDMFVASVAANRDMTQKAVRATEAATYMGEKAVTAGLADEVGSLEDALAGLRVEITRRQTMEFKARMAAQAGLPEASAEAEIATAIEAKLAEGKSLADKAAAATKDLEGAHAELAKIKSDALAREAEHVITLAKTEALAAGLIPLPKDIEDDARAMLAIGKPELAKRTLDRHLDAARSKVSALRNPAAKVQKDEKVGEKEARRAAEDAEIEKIKAAGRSAKLKGKPAK